MINNLSILFSLTMVVYVVVRASVLDAKQQWFPKAAPPEAPPGTAPGGGVARRPARTRR